MKYVGQDWWISYSGRFHSLPTVLECYLISYSGAGNTRNWVDMIGGLTIHDAHALWVCIQLDVATTEEGEQVVRGFDRSGRYLEKTSAKKKTRSNSDKKGANISNLLLVLPSSVSVWRRSFSRESSA